VLGKFAAQDTDKGRTGAVTEFAQRFYFALAHEAEEEAVRLSAPDEDADGPVRTLRRELAHHFTLNLDEQSCQASLGTSHIIGDRTLKKHEKNQSSSRVSITSLECGSAAGVDGPTIYLIAGVAIPTALSKQHGNSKWLELNGASKGSFVQMTPTAFMTNDTWDAGALRLTRGIRNMPVIRDYPDMVVVLHLDGYKSHVMTYIAHLIFREHRILVVNFTFSSHPTNPT
jgi:hypothetical protein